MLIITQFISKSIAFDIKIGLFVSYELANTFYETFNLKDNANKVDILQTFVFSSYSYGVSIVFYVDLLRSN